MNNRIEYLSPERICSDNPIWVDPVGGLGDIIMLSTALKRAHEKYGRKFCMSRRTRYTEFFVGHPAIEEIGCPPYGSDIVCNDYWSRSDFKDIHNKALSIVLKIFGVTDFNDDTLYMVERELDEQTVLLLNNIPWTKRTVAISFSSESPRKMMHPFKWHSIVERLLLQQCTVIQIGNYGDIPIRGAYSLLGVTTPIQVLEILKMTNLVITLDNYVMHAAKLTQTPTIALFGPTESERYGYKKHICLTANKSQCMHTNECLGPHVPENYATMCPLHERHCMNSFDENKIVDIAMTILNK